MAENQDAPIFVGFESQNSGLARLNQDNWQVCGNQNFERCQLVTSMQELQCSKPQQYFLQNRSRKK